MKPHLLALAVAAAILGSPASAEDKKAPPAPNHQYLIILDHSAEDCAYSIHDVAHADAQFLARVAWGCGAGDHRGYVLVHATSADQALHPVPGSIRAWARVEEVSTIRSAAQRKAADDQVRQATVLLRAE
jgi:hypothetical protein